MIESVSTLGAFIKRQPPIKTIAFYLYFFGGIGCLLFAVISFLDRNWVNVATSSTVLFTVFVAFYLFDSLDADVLFGIVSLGALVALLVGTTFNFGVNDGGLQAVYPILLMIGIAFRRRPKWIVAVGLFIIIWVILLFLLEIEGFYIDKSEPFDLTSKTIFIIFMILFMVMMLQVALQNLLSANQKLEVAKEEAMAAKTVAENANRAKSVFLANMSHELRTPLNAIIGYSEIIAEENGGEISEDADRISRSALDLLKIIDSILEVSNFESGKILLDLVPQNLTLIVDSAVNSMERQFQEKRNRLKVNFDPSAKTVVADGQKLSLIITNLLDNANKFMSEGEIELTSIYDDGEIIIAISDSGVGMSAETLERVIAPFQQANNELNRSYDGAGLGLSICHSYANMMNGSLEIKSEEGVGTTVYLRLPAVVSR